MLNFFTKRSVGVDIADRTIEVVEILKDREGTRVWSKGRVELEPGIVEGARVKDKAKLREALKKALQKAKPHPIITRKAVFGLPECRVYIHNFYVTEHKKEEREDLILNEALANFPLKKEELVYSYRIIPSSGEKGKTEVLLAASSRETVSEWSDFFASSGLDVDVFDVESLAVFRGLFPEPIKKPVCVIDIGAAAAHVAIFDSNSLWYSYCSGVAGNALTKEIAAALGNSEQEAEEMKKEIGLSRPGDKIFFALTKVLHPMAEDVKATLDYFKKQAGEGVERIILVGGTSKLKGLADYIQTNLGLPVETGKSALMKGEANLVYVEAAGLALRGIEAKWNERDPAIPVERGAAGERMNKSAESGDKKAAAGGIAPKSVPPAKKAGAPAPKRSGFSIRARRWALIFVSALIISSIAFAGAYLYRAREQSRQRENARAKAEAVKALEKIKSERVKKEEKIKAELEAAKKAAEAAPEVLVKKTPTGWLNVRKGPGTGYAKAGKVYPGETYELLEEKNNWYKIKTGDESEGWIIKTYAEKQ